MAVACGNGWFLIDQPGMRHDQTGLMAVWLGLALTGVLRLK